MFGHKFKYEKLYDVKSPTRGTKFSAGIDFYIPECTDQYEELIQKYVYVPSDKKLIIHPYENILIPSGLKISYPKNKAMLFLNKSGIASKKSLIVGAELHDWDYMYEMFFDIHNIGSSSVTLDFGQKIVQGILIPAYYYSLVECKTDRELFGKREKTRTGGFGSTGIK